MAMAQRRMLSVFGIELMEVERPSESKKGVRSCVHAFVFACV